MTAEEFLKGLPTRVSSEAIAGHNTCFHFDLAGDGGGEYTLNIEDGVATVVDGMVGEAKCVVKTKADVLMGIVGGSENAMMAFMMGKIKVNNQGEMLKYAKVLGLM